MLSLRLVGWSWLLIPAEDRRCCQVGDVGGQEWVICRGTEVPGLPVSPTTPSRGTFWAASRRGSKRTAWPHLPACQEPAAMVCAARCPIHHLCCHPSLGRSRSELRVGSDGIPLPSLGWGSPCAPHSLQSTPARLHFLCRYVFFKVLRSLGFFCLVDFLLLIQLKGSENHALD